MIMKIAIPIWNDRVSPVMDTACQLLIVDKENGKEVSRSVIDIPQLHMVQRAGFVSRLGVDVLICGAISHQLETFLTISGIEIIPWVRGGFDRVLEAHQRGDLLDQSFLLPGCRRGGRRRRMGHGRGRQRGLGAGEFLKEDL